MPLHFPKRLEGNVSTRNGSTGSDGGGGEEWYGEAAVSPPPRLTIEAFEIAISTERKVIATLVTGKLMSGRNGKATLSLVSTLPYPPYHPPFAPDALSHSVRVLFFLRPGDKLDLIIASRDYDSHVPRSSVQLAR